MKKLSILLLALLFAFGCQENENEEPEVSEEDVVYRDSVQIFLDSYDEDYKNLAYEYQEADWLLNTKIVEGDTITSKKAEDAYEKYAKFIGSKENIERAQEYLKYKNRLSDLQVRQLNRILYNAASNPEVAEEVVKEKIKADTKQTELLFGYDYKIDGKSVSTNEIDRMLNEETDVQKRLKVWEASKEVGKVLKEGLSNLQLLRNKSVQALGYDDYFTYQVSDYGMTVEEMRQLNHQMIKDIWPLYRELHTWARYELAEKYGKEIPEMLPAHWLPNRWGQDWAALVDVEGLDIDSKLKEKNAEWIVEQGEKFYVSLGFDSLPSSFYEKSSLYPLPAGANYKKNNHASAWHFDLNRDVRSLMSVEPNTRWWSTTLHELGHIYYFLEYSNDDVPIVLREGANRGYHEAIGSLIGLAAMQKPFLQEFGLADENAETDTMITLLKEALEYIVFIPWSAGVMTDFEYELYTENLPVNKYNQTWWDMKKKFQGIVPPYERGEEYCDAATKTHINNDAAQYYDYAISYVLLFQFHDYIAKNILKQDPHSTNYYGNKEVGKFLKDLMYPGATVDWREHIKETIGSDMSAKPMVDYFAPLMDYLKEQNKGREHTLPETI